VSIDWTNNDEFNASAEKMHDAITSLQQAIAKLESQEPVSHQKWCASLTQLLLSMPPQPAPCNCHPPQRTWVGLTDEDLEPLCNEWRIVFGSWTYEFAKAIEAKLKEKNT
jgi:hypothetical protein